MTAGQASTGRETARQLLARETAGAKDPAAIALALQRAATRVSVNLRGSVGDDGYHALLARVLSRTENEHPALKDIRRNGAIGPSLDGIAASVETHGVPAVTEALESVLGAIVDVLSSLIGSDLVLNLLEHDVPPLQTPSGRKTQ